MFLPRYFTPICCTASFGCTCWTRSYPNSLVFYSIMLSAKIDEREVSREVGHHRGKVFAKRIDQPIVRFPFTVPSESVFLALVLILMQVVRRLCECVFVSVYSPGAKMHLIHYIYGSLYYFGVGLSVLAEANGLTDYRKPLKLFGRVLCRLRRLLIWISLLFAQDPISVRPQWNGATCSPRDTRSELFCSCWHPICTITVITFWLH